METLFRNQKIEIWVKGENKYAMTVFNHRLAQKVNAVLKYYPNGTRFEKGEEPVFPFFASQIEFIEATLPVLRKILAQVFKG